MRRVAMVLLVLAAASAAPAEMGAPASSSPLEPAGTGGLAAVDLALAKLSTHRRLLVVGAHPDDEDTTLLALVGRELGGEAAYLSLSRGEGGQNLVGPELGVGLGLIRTGELLAARRIEGTRQYFTRAFDFGYTRSLGETLDRWPREVLQQDAMRALRRLKPQVVVAVFPADARTGHGQHQASGVIAEDLFRLAGWPDRFPQLTAEGLPPWQPQALYRRVWWSEDDASLQFPLGGVDPHSGRSIFQVAAASRSMHRSQDMGTLQQLGRRFGRLTWVAGEAAEDAKDIFGGIDTRLSAIAAVLPVGPKRDRIEAGLRQISELAQETRRGLSPVGLEGAVAPLAQIVSSLRRLVAEASESDDGPATAVVIDLLQEKIQIASSGLAAAAGVAVDALADRESIPLGGALTARAIVWNSGHQPVEVKSVDISCQPGWRVGSGPRREDEAAADLPGWEFELELDTDASPTSAYFLKQPLVGDLYDWEKVPFDVRGKPLEPPPAVARFGLEIAGAAILLEREVVYGYRDQALGEVRRPLRAVPPLEVSVAPPMILWPVQAGGERRLEVVLRSNSDEPLRGRLELRSAEAWPGVVAREFHIGVPRARQVVAFSLPAPRQATATRIALSAVAVLEDGRSFNAAYPVVSYAHVRPLARPVAARVEVQTLDLELPEIEHLGYIRGASDRVPEILLEVGLPVKMLTATELSSGDLSRYDAIVVGSRAYETEPALAEANHRLLAYVRGGGHLLVQYQQYQFVGGGYAPYALEIGRPHGRVTDEHALVRLLQPEHSVFQRPNPISERDWQHWVQERGLYFASSWDPSYTALLTLNDKGEPEERGGLLVARVDQGTYIYTGLSFFRQLPAGVPGALRLFVNLLTPGGA